MVRKDPGTSRIVVRTEIGTTGPTRRLMATALAWGDLLMMHKQLRTLKQLAEAPAAGSRTGEPGPP